MIKNFIFSFDSIFNSIIKVYHVVDYVRAYNPPDSSDDNLVWETIPKTSRIDISWAPGCNIPGNDFLTVQTDIPCHNNCEVIFFFVLNFLKIFQKICIRMLVCPKRVALILLG